MPSPAQRGVVFTLPMLTVEDETGQRVLFDAEVVRENAAVDLLEYPADLRELEYDASTRRYVLDVQGERLELELMGSEDLRLSVGATEMTEVELVAWLHPKLRDMTMTQTMVSAWALQAVRGWLARPGVTLAVVDRGRFILLRRLQEAIATAKETEATKAYQAMLFGKDSTVLADAEYSFRFPESYTPNYVCKGVRFRKHYYRQVGEMKDEGEEFRCAVEIDSHPEVEFWVRNLPGIARVGTSFWLQTATDRFYPDFVVRLKDGVTLVVEYKGESYKSNDDSKEKDRLGQIWAKLSGGRGKFLMAVARDSFGRGVRAQIDAAVRAGGVR